MLDQPAAVLAYLRSGNASSELPSRLLATPYLRDSTSSSSAPMSAPTPAARAGGLHPAGRPPRGDPHAGRSSTWPLVSARSWRPPWAPRRRPRRRRLQRQDAAVRGRPRRRRHRRGSSTTPGWTKPAAGAPDDDDVRRGGNDDVIADFAAAADGAPRRRDCRWPGRPRIFDGNPTQADWMPRAGRTMPTRPPCRTSAARPAAPWERTRSSSP
jgi:hypothetical protein